jgi:predicted O-methyltransferase YrrM
MRKMIDNFIVYPETKLFIDQYFSYPEPFLKDYHELALSMNCPIVQPDLASWLFLTVKSLMPKRCLEIGTNIGFSAAWISTAYKECKIDSIEFKHENVEFAREQFKKYKLDEKITVHQSEAIEFLKTLDDKTKYDFVFIDANKKDNQQYIELLSDHLNKNALVCIDNILWKGRTAAKSLIESSSMDSTLAIRKFCNWMKLNPDYYSQVLAIGDGVILATKL